MANASGVDGSGCSGPVQTQPSAAGGESSPACGPSGADEVREMPPRPPSSLLVGVESALSTRRLGAPSTTSHKGVVSGGSAQASQVAADRDGTPAPPPRPAEGVYTPRISLGSSVAPNSTPPPGTIAYHSVREFLNAPDFPSDPPTLSSVMSQRQRQSTVPTLPSVPLQRHQSVQLLLGPEKKAASARGGSVSARR